METQVLNPAPIDRKQRAPAAHAPASIASPGKGFDHSQIRRIALLLAALLAVTVGGVYLREWWQVGRFLETTDDAFVGADITTISSKVPGFIAKVLVTDNQHVRAGELLAVIDDRDYRAELARADATVDGQKAALANLDAAARLQAAMIDQAQARTESTAAEKQRAAADGVRATDLVKRRVVSEQDFEQVNATVTKARRTTTPHGSPLSEHNASSR